MGNVMLTLFTPVKSRYFGVNFSRELLTSRTVAAVRLDAFDWLAFLHAGAASIAARTPPSRCKLPRAQQLLAWKAISFSLAIVVAFFLSGSTMKTSGIDI